MKSRVMASMFTGTSFSACLVRLAESVSLADQPVSRSVAMMNGESSTGSSRTGAAGAGAVWAAAGPVAAPRAMLRHGSERVTTRSTADIMSLFMGILTWRKWLAGRLANPPRRWLF